MQVKNVLLTGAGGKIGRAVLPELAKAGYQVRALEYTDGLKVDRLDNVEVVCGDLRDPSLARRLIEGMDVVIHLANVKENKELFLDANVKGTFYLLDACKEAGHIKQYIQAGSDARAGIYYYPQPIPIDENHRHSGYPGYYPLSKVLEEVMCEQYQIMYGMPITILRFSWVHDEDDILAHVTLSEPNLGVPVWKDWAVTAEQKAYFEKGTNAVACLVHPDGSAGKRQIVGIKDVVRSILLAIGNPTAIGEAFNISGPSPFAYDVLAEYVAKKLDLAVVRFEVSEFRDFCIDMSKSRAVLGFDPEYDIFRIVDDALEFRKAGRTRSVCPYPG
ncbi:MAG: NAD(P)-dependent oxidoreductase [Pirellulales bacterium]|jgi:nucleoside-diphosphate-sugar epimerase|nr:NAD(P)-dependent oxidoreductase [Thermoguttaceae bacterium]MDD4788465.1 NAD(P)-dependent oxidoreductase [Pirellulales bacterium]NLZ01905.1 NAD(P)-dependent oxidoreductase [Pirellulaceae bacterium]